MPPISALGGASHIAEGAGASNISYHKLGDVIGVCDLAIKQRDSVCRHYLLITEGDGRAFVDDDEFELSPGVLLVIPVNALFSFSLSAGADGFIFSGTELFFRERVAAALLDRPASHWKDYYQPNAYYTLAGPDRNNDRARVFGQVEEAAEHFGIGSDAAVMAYIFVLVSVRRRASPPVTDSGKQRYTDLVYRYHALVDEHYGKHLGIDDYCRRLSVTRGQLLGACRLVSGLTPLEVIHRRVLLEAERELLRSDQTVNEIAFNLGFRDSAYFSRFFKRMTGVSPVAFRLERLGQGGAQDGDIVVITGPGQA